MVYTASSSPALRRLLLIATMAIVLTALALTALRWTGPVPPPSTTTAPAATEPLAAVAASKPAERVEVIVRFAGDVSPAQARDLVAANRGRVTHDLRLIGGVGATMPAAQAARLAEDRRVEALTLNQEVESTSRPLAGEQPANRGDADGLRTSFVQSVRADQAWRHPKGASGEDVAVAVIDTGVDGGHPDFIREDGTSAVKATAVVNPDATDDGDPVGHGTHVAGLIAGDSANRDADDPLRGAYAGTAPDADIVSVKVGDDEGRATVLDVIYGLQFAVDHAEKLDIRVVNLSVMAPSQGSYRQDPLDAAVESAWLQGLVVVTAAGNEGDAEGAVDHAPANDPYAISVGAVDDQGTHAIGDDALAGWSSRGTTQDGFAKPEVVAPGAHIVAPLAPGSQFERACSTCVVDGQYFRVGGTSMAAPIVAGVAADLVSAHPEWTPDQIKGALTNTARPVGDGQREIAADLALLAGGLRLKANEGLQPNTLVSAETGEIDYTRMTWGRMTWGTEQVLETRTTWGRTTWGRMTWGCDCAQGTSDEVDDTRMTWGYATWLSDLTK